MSGHRDDLPKKKKNRKKNRINFISSSYRNRIKYCGDFFLLRHKVIGNETDNVSPIT